MEKMKLIKSEQVGALVRKGFVILWASAIFWFYLGNLINFHQNRIWGKVLIPACFTHSSVNNKDFSTLQHTGHDSFNSSPDFDLEGISDIDIPVISGEISFIQILHYLLHETTEYKQVVSGFSLRGPPAA